MKRRELIKLFEKSGCHLKRDGGNHEIWTNDVKTEEIPRHREINEMLAQYLIKKHGLK